MTCRACSADARTVLQPIRPGTHPTVSVVRYACALARFLALLAMLASAAATAQDTFVVEDIRLEGLQRISAGTVFNYLPVQVGDRINAERTAEAIRALFRTGFFNDVRIERDGNTLVVLVVERPSIARDRKSVV